MKERREVFRSPWKVFCRIYTFLIPDCLLKRSGCPNASSMMAWREKVVLFSFITILCLLLLLFVIVLPLIMCPSHRILSNENFQYLCSQRPHVIVHGTVYDVSSLVDTHTTNGAKSRHILAASCLDVSDHFPWDPTIHRSRKFGFSIEYLQHIFRYPSRRVEKCCLPFKKPMHSAENYANLRFNSKYFYLGFSPEELRKGRTRSRALISVDGFVYNASLILDKLHKSLSPEGQRLVNSPWGLDKTPNFCYPEARKDLNIMDEFIVGVIDPRFLASCRSTSLFLIISSLGIVLLIFLKLVAAMKVKFTKKPRKMDNFVIVQIPCFSENEESLLQTINSVVNLNYENAMMFIISDGYNTSPGPHHATPTALMSILDIVDDGDEGRALLYQAASAGPKRYNRAKVFSGTYNRIPFLLIMKTGLAGETFMRGNRGKRDSQVLLLRFLSNLYLNGIASPLESEIYRHFSQDLGLDPRIFEFIMMVDADTVLHPESLNALVSDCVRNQDIAGICGETRILNEHDSLISMAQVYEYWVSFSFTKTFESMFGAVTCLPGCFSLFRLRKKTSLGCGLILTKPELIDNYSVSDLETLHLKNLLGLGEDRYLTTLLLKHFPAMQIKYNARAIAWTKAPSTWRSYLAQRRRWINSTVHNLFELLRVPGLCRISCISLKVIVLLDLFGTLVAPSSVVYFAYLVNSQ